MVKKIKFKSDVDVVVKDSPILESQQQYDIHENAKRTLLQVTPYEYNLLKNGKFKDQDISKVTEFKTIEGRSGYKVVSGNGAQLLKAFDNTIDISACGKIGIWLYGAHTPGAISGQPDVRIKITSSGGDVNLKETYFNVNVQKGWHLYKFDLLNSTDSQYLGDGYIGYTARVGDGCDLTRVNCICVFNYFDISNIPPDTDQSVLDHFRNAAILIGEAFPITDDINVGKFSVDKAEWKDDTSSSYYKYKAVLDAIPISCKITDTSVVQFIIDGLDNSNNISVSDKNETKMNADGKTMKITLYAMQEPTKTVYGHVVCFNPRGE